MATTNNGWPTDPAVNRIWVGNDPDGCEFAAGDVTVVFTYFFTRFHQEIELVHMLNGYRSSEYNDTIPGSVKSSNHVSGTAGDVNGDWHPNEANGGSGSSGFTAAQSEQVRALVAHVGVLKWGADFPPGARDWMHFEISGNASRV